jgi:gamma-glutamyl hydrolase
MRRGHSLYLGLVAIILQNVYTANAARLLPVNSLSSSRKYHDKDHIISLSQQAHSKTDDDQEKLNLRPLIGVLSQGGIPAPKGHSYIAASYIKFVEAAGARAVPILHDMDPEEVTRRFKAVNGILLPGGSQDLRSGNPYFDTAELLFKLTIEANENGDYFPLHGTCLGFEALAILAAKNESLLADFDAEDYSQPLFPTEFAPTSRFFTALPPHVVTNLHTKPYAMQNHAHGVAYEAFASNPALNNFFDVLTLSVDRQDALYVSTMESPDYPISATQWHPEKNAFEWTLDKKSIPHHPDAIEVTQEVANYLVGSARKNFHRPENRDAEEDMLIYAWNEGLEYSGTRKFEGEEVDFDEIYVFPDQETYLKKIKEQKRKEEKWRR